MNNSVQKLELYPPLIIGYITLKIIILTLYLISL